MVRNNPMVTICRDLQVKVTALNVLPKCYDVLWVAVPAGDLQWWRWRVTFHRWGLTACNHQDPRSCWSSLAAKKETTKENLPRLFCSNVWCFFKIVPVVDPLTTASLTRILATWSGCQTPEVSLISLVSKGWEAQRVKRQTGVTVLLSLTKWKEI